MLARPGLPRNGFGTRVPRPARRVESSLLSRIGRAEVFPTRRDCRHGLRSALRTSDHRQRGDGRWYQVLSGETRKTSQVHKV